MKALTPAGHDVIVYGPCREGERTISGGTYPMPGYGWSCSCGVAGFGHETDDDASDWADLHLAKLASQ